VHLEVILCVLRAAAIFEGARLDRLFDDKPSTREILQCSPSLLSRDACLGSGGSSCARIVSFVSRKASITRLADRAMEIIDVEACRRSRYRSLRLYCKCPERP
jgi:hypothetical protein